MPGSKKVHTKRASEDPADPYVHERNYFPSAMIGKALGLHPKYPEPNRAAKSDREKPRMSDTVGLSDIRKKYQRKGND